MEPTWNYNHEVAGGKISNVYFNSTSDILVVKPQDLKDHGAIFCPQEVEFQTAP